MGLADVGVGGVGVEVGGAVGGAEVVAGEPEPSLGGMTRTCGWREGPKNYRDKFDRASAGSTGRRQQHDTLRNARLERGDPGG